MSAWGTGLFSDDLACDVRDELTRLLSDGLEGEAVLAKLELAYASSLRDPLEAPVFWLAVAYSAWKLGRPIKRATLQAIGVLETGDDLKRWANPSERRRREAVLARIGRDLNTQPRARKRLKAAFVANNLWAVGEVVAYRLNSGDWTLFRVIGHHRDRGGCHAICEPLDWTGSALPDDKAIAGLPLRPPREAKLRGQFMIGETGNRRIASRFVTTCVITAPVQSPDRYMAFIFPWLDRQLDEFFGIH